MWRKYLKKQIIKFYTKYLYNYLNRETGPSNIIIAKSPTIENQFSVPIESSIPSPSVVPKRESDTKIIETK